MNRSGSTKERILAAAETLFAQRGFDGASLRQLTSDAGVNLAAVNYHFGSKEKLVEQVFRRLRERLPKLRQHTGDAQACADRRALGHAGLPLLHRLGRLEGRLRRGRRLGRGRPSGS